MGVFLKDFFTTRRKVQASRLRPPFNTHAHFPERR
jgi:hypothetical protein